MKPLALNLSKMKKIASDKDSSTFLHPAGHKMVIAHKPLSALHRKQVEQMPIQKFDDGGEALDLNAKAAPEVLADNNNIGYAAAGVDPASVPAPGVSGYVKSLGEAAPPEDEAPIIEAAGKALQGSAPQDSVKSSEASPIPGDGLPSSLPVSVPDASALQPQASHSMAALEQYQKAILGGANAEAQAANQTAKAFGEYANQMQALPTPQQIVQRAAQGDYELQKAFENKQVDPNHFWNSKTTGGKISAALGLILGGAGAGLTRGPNLAMDHINRMIEHDIDAQKNDQSKAYNLWKMNREQTHSDQEANLMTQNQLLSSVKAKALQYQSVAAGAEAKARIAPVLLEIDHQMGVNRFMQALANPQVDKSNISALDLAKAGIVPAQEAAKEQSSIDAQKMAIQKTHELFDAMKKEQTLGNLKNPQSYSRMKAIKSELVNAVMNASASKRLTRESIEQEIDPLMVGTFNTGETVDSKTQGMMNIIQRHADPTPYMSRYVPQAIPKYTPGPEIQVRGGVQYQKVPGGWAKVR